MYSDRVVGLRERRHQQTKEHLVESAFALFLEHGFENVTMELIAFTAGVSRSTVYRRFPTKEHLVLEAPRHWLTVFDKALDELPEDATANDAVEVTTLAVARYIDDNHDFVYMAYTILGQSPSLQQTGMATTAWFERYVSMIQDRTDLSTGDTRTLAGAYVGAFDAVMQHWASTGGTASASEAISAMLQRLAPILPDRSHQ